MHFSERGLPDMRGQKLEIIPASPQTIKDLTDLVHQKLGGHFVGYITSEDANYTCMDYIKPNQPTEGDLLTLVHEEPKDKEAEDTDYTVSIFKSDLKIRKVQVPQALMRGIEQIEAHQRKNIQDQHDLEELTGLPSITEGEVRRLLRKLRHGQLQSDYEA